MSKNTEKKNDKKFNDILGEVKKKKDKSKSADKKIDNSNGNGNIDGNVNGKVDSNGDSNLDNDDSIKSQEQEDSKDDRDSKFTINLSKKEKEPEKIKRTYYIYEEDDEKLNELARHSGKDKSELVRIAIGFLYDNAEVE